MPWGLRRFQEARCLHFVTFSCYRRAPLLGTPGTRDVFEQVQQTRQWYGFYVSGYVVMPEHVHLLVSEPERGKLSTALQMLKQNVSRELREKPRPVPAKNAGTRTGHPLLMGYPSLMDREMNTPRAPFWLEREKLRYVHRNPVHRGLVEKPEDWAWSSFRHYATGAESAVEIESQWTTHKRERRLGSTFQIVQKPRPVSAKNAEARTGHPPEQLPVNKSAQN